MKRLRLFSIVVLLTVVSHCSPCPPFSVQYCEGGRCICQSVLETAH